VEALSISGIEVERIPLVVSTDPLAHAYLEAKRAHGQTV
jgi:hypothetical protein